MRSSRVTLPPHTHLCRSESVLPIQSTSAGSRSQSSARAFRGTRRLGSSGSNACVCSAAMLRRYVVVSVAGFDITTGAPGGWNLCASIGTPGVKIGLGPTFGTGFGCLRCVGSRRGSSLGSGCSISTVHLAVVLVDRGRPEAPDAHRCEPDVVLP